MIKLCETCKNEFEAKRSSTRWCSRLCYRKADGISQKYCKRTSEYQAKHSKEPGRRYQKLIFKCNHEHKELDITKEHFITLLSMKCDYCGSSIKDETGCGLDRLDNTKGYLVSNVVPCCGPCNQIRNVHLTYDEMKVAMAAVVAHRGL